MKDENDRIERLLALILLEIMKEKKQEDKVRSLNVAAFSNLEISELLNVSPQVVANYLYKSKKPKKSAKSESK